MFIKYSDKAITAAYGEGWDTPSPTQKNSGFNLMVDAFKEIPLDQICLVNHALAQYFSKRFINYNPTKHGLSITKTEIDQSCNFELSYLLNNGHNPFILDVEYIKELIFKYALFFDAMTYHDAITDIRNVTGETCYGYKGLGLYEVMKVDEYIKITQNGELFNQLQGLVIVGFKSLRDK